MLIALFTLTIEKKIDLGKIFTRTVLKRRDFFARKEDKKIA
jgi:hypothetical protein